MATDQKTIRMYSKNALAYAKHVRDKAGSVYHSLYEKPAMYALLPDLSGKKIISLGCGTGEDVQHLKSLGPREVVGIDIAKGMIEIASKSYPGSDFRVMSIEQLDFKKEYFDFAYSSLAMHYLQNWEKGLAEVFRVLKPGGSFLLSCFHPVNTARVVTEDSARRKVRQLATVISKDAHDIEIIGDYLSTKKINDHQESIGPVTTWHKPLGEIFSEAKNAGFLIDQFVEPKPQAVMKKVSSFDYAKLSKIPAFMIIKFSKPL